MGSAARLSPRGAAVPGRLHGRCGVKHERAASCLRRRRQRLPVGRHDVRQARHPQHRAASACRADCCARSCCVDEVAALHADADCVVHFGRSCMSPVTRLPSRLVYARQPVDTAQLAARLVEVRCVARTAASASSSALTRTSAAQHGRSCGCRVVLVLFDQECAHAQAALQSSLPASGGDGPQFVFGDPPQTQLEPAAARASGACCGASAACAGPAHADVEPPDQAPPDACDDSTQFASGVSWSLPAGVSFTDCALVWVGGANASLLRLLMSLPLLPDGAPMACARFDPATLEWEHSASQTAEAARVLKRRYYLVERARQASIVGLVAGTLGVSGFRSALQRVRQLAEEAGKKTYTLLVGKPNPAKLANFPEARVFVASCCMHTALTCAPGGGLCPGRVPPDGPAGLARFPGTYHHGVRGRAGVHGLSLAAWGVSLRLQRRASSGRRARRRARKHHGCAARRRCGRVRLCAQQQHAAHGA